MGSDDPARRLHAVLSIVIAAGMDHARARARARDVFVSEARQTIYFLGRPRMVKENGEVLTASPFQPLFHVRHGVGGSEAAPLNLWSIVLLTNPPDPRYCKPFEQMVRTGLLPCFIEIYIERDRRLALSRI
jgi:hypothetical protein